MMLSEKKMELLNRAIGYRECILDILDSGLVHGDALEKIIAMGNIRYSLKTLVLCDAGYGLKVDEVLEND